MKKIVTTNETSTSASPYKVETKAFIRDGEIECLDALAKAIIGSSYDPTKAYLLYGLTATGTDPGARTVSAGAVFFNGEIYLIPAFTGTTTGGDVLVCTITETPDPVADPTIFSDGQTFNIHNDRTIVISVGASGSADFNFDDIVRNNPTWVEPNLNANFSQANYPTNPKAAYIKDGNVVRLRGRIRYTDSTSGSDIVAFTLPAGFRPVSELIFVVNASVIANSAFTLSSNLGQISFRVKANGDVVLIDFVRLTSAAQCDYSLDGISFRID